VKSSERRLDDCVIDLLVPEELERRRGRRFEHADRSMLAGADYAFPVSHDVQRGAEHFRRGRRSVEPQPFENRMGVRIATTYAGAQNHHSGSVARYGEVSLDHRRPDARSGRLRYGFLLRPRRIESGYPHRQEANQHVFARSFADGCAQDA
jgi:hypothetical protein